MASWNVAGRARMEDAFYRSPPLWKVHHQQNCAVCAARKFSIFDRKRVNNNHHSRTHTNTLFHRIRWQNDGSLLKLEYYSHLLCIFSGCRRHRCCFCCCCHTLQSTTMCYFVCCLLLLTFGFALMMLFTWADFVPNRLFIRILCFLQQQKNLAHFVYPLLVSRIFLLPLAIRWTAAVAAFLKHSCTYHVDNKQVGLVAVGP